MSQPILRCPQELSKNLNIPLNEKMIHPFFSMPNGDLIHVPMPDAFCARTKMSRTDLLSPICVATTKYKVTRLVALAFISSAVRFAQDKTLENEK